MDEVARKRAENNRDNREWTAKDALEEALERIKDVDPKKVHLMVLWREDIDDSSSRLRWNAANIQRHDQISVLEMMKFDLCRDWFSEE